MVLEGRMIMHVDDDSEVLQQVGDHLGYHGFTAIGVDDPSRAITLLVETNCRVVLLDIEMPEIDGMTLLKAIKQHDGGIQVIMLTDLAPMTTVLKSMRMGAEACLIKPLDDFQSLDLAIDAAFRKIDRWWSSHKELIEFKRQMQLTRKKRVPAENSPAG